MTLQHRLDRLQRIAQEQRPAGSVPVELWLPAKPGGEPPGRYPDPGGRYVRIVYEPGETLEGKA